MHDKKYFMIKSEITDDPFVKGLFARMPVAEQALFTEQQLVALKSAMGARTWGSHPVDIRWTFKFWRWRYYFVFLSGVNRRPPTRIVKELELWGKTVLMFSLLSVSVLTGLLTIYLAKSAVGIDLVPGFSLGIWGWFQEAFLQ